MCARDDASRDVRPCPSAGKAGVRAGSVILELSFAAPATTPAISR